VPRGYAAQWHTHRPRAAYPHWQAMNASMRRAASASTARLRVKRVASNSAIWRARRSAVGMEGVPDARPVLGGVCCLDRHVADGQPWSAAAATSDLVVTPAACYPVYPLVAARGEVPAAGLLFDVAADCFRREPSRQLDRLQSFRMREFVCIGSAEQASAFRACWLARAEELAGRLGLNWRIDKASDPFFGRTGKLLAMSQVEQSLKYELLVPVYSQERPTACMSFNYHLDHFGETWQLRTTGGALAHTACVAFGIDRLALALFVTHGADCANWPRDARAALQL